MNSLNEANRMLETFASVGATHFDVTFLDIDGEKRGFRKAQSVLQLRNSLPKLFPGLTERHNSLVIRPVPNKVALVQLDDLDAPALERVQSVAFLTLATSPGNHQAWVAVDHFRDMTKMVVSEFGRRLRKGTGADLSASGAVRLAGTRNFKVKYAPTFPTVSIVSTVHGRIVTPEKLEQAGLLAAPDKPRPPPPLRVSTSKSWPDYERCVQGAPLNHSGTAVDISRADYFFALLCAQRGHAIEEITARLMEESPKARENGERYARITAENATAAAERGRQRSRT
jgi:hypothetical protein